MPDAALKARSVALTGYYCGCSGAVAGGGVAVGAVGVEPGSKYQTMISARTTTAAMMSNLFVSIESTYCSLAAAR